MKNLLTFNYWFNLNPESLIPYAQQIFLAFLVLLFILTILIAIIKKRSGIYKGFFKRLYSFCLSNTLIGLILWFFNYETIPFFSARFWLGLWALSMLAWLIFILLKLKNIPQQKKQREKEQELKKYLP